MKKILLTLVLLMSLNIAWSQSRPENIPIHKVIIEFFEGISNLDDSRIKEQVTADFLLLEVGEIWTIDTLINVLSRNLKGKAYKRVNKLDFFRTDQQGDIAWVNYHNQADIAVDDKKYTVYWLESAILKKIGGNWKMVQMHSTRINKKQ